MCLQKYGLIFKLPNVLILLCIGIYIFIRYTELTAPCAEVEFNAPLAPSNLRGGMLKQHRAARGDTVPDRHPARLDNLKFSAFFPKRANVSLSSRYLHALHIAC